MGGHLFKRVRKCQTATNMCWPMTYLLTSSPVLCWSKKLISCSNSEWNKAQRSLVARRSPSTDNTPIYRDVRAPCTNDYHNTPSILSLVHWQTYMHSLTHSLTRSHKLTHSLTHSHTDWLTDWLTDSHTPGRRRVESTVVLMVVTGWYSLSVHDQPSMMIQCSPVPLTPVVTVCWEQHMPLHSTHNTHYHRTRFN